MADTWSILPFEIIVAISGKLVEPEYFEHLRAEQRALAAVRLACKRYAEAVPHAVKSLSVVGAFPDGTLSRNLSCLESMTWERGIASPSFAAPKSLRVLKLSYALPCQSLMNLCTDFRAIEHLELRWIPLTDVSPLASLTNLRSLSLILHNSLGRHPRRKHLVGLERLSNITSLTLQDNHMESLPPAVFQLTKLESIAIPDCRQFTSLRSMEQFPRLTALDLTGCYRAELSTIPPTILSLNLTRGEMVLADLYSAVGTSLKSLDMSYSSVYYEDVEELRTLGMMTSLETLILKDSMDFGYTDVKYLSSLKRLTALDISGSEHGKIDDGLGSLSSLTSLKLNSICLPEDIGVLSRLTGLTTLQVQGRLTADEKIILRDYLPNIAI